MPIHRFLNSSALWAWILGLGIVATGCVGSSGKITRLQEENAQLAERIRQDQVRLLNLEEQNRTLQTRLADAEKAVATLHDASTNEIKRR
jgi:hypothetical protein